MTKRHSSKGGYDRTYLEALIEEATVDCYDEYEQATGLLTMIEDELDLPFTTRIFGLEVAVVAIEQDDRVLALSPSASGRANASGYLSANFPCSRRHLRARNGSLPTGSGRGTAGRPARRTRHERFPLP